MCKIQPPWGMPKSTRCRTTTRALRSWRAELLDASAEDSDGSSDDADLQALEAEEARLKHTIINDDSGSSDDDGKQFIKDAEDGWESEEDFDLDTWSLQARNKLVRGRDFLDSPDREKERNCPESGFRTYATVWMPQHATPCR